MRAARDGSVLLVDEADKAPTQVTCILKVYMFLYIFYIYVYLYVLFVLFYMFIYIIYICFFKSIYVLNVIYVFISREGFLSIRLSFLGILYFSIDF